MAFKLLVLVSLVACASAGVIPLDYTHAHYSYPAHAVVVHKPVASSYSYFHKVDHSVPVIKTVLPPPVVYKPLYHPLPVHFDHDFYHGYGHHF